VTSGSSAESRGAQPDCENKQAAGGGPAEGAFPEYRVPLEGVLAVSRVIQGHHDLPVAFRHASAGLRRGGRGPREPRAHEDGEGRPVCGRSTSSSSSSQALAMASDILFPNERLINGAASSAHSIRDTC